MRQLFALLVLFIMLFVVFNTFRTPLLRKLGTVLIKDDSLQKADVLVVLSGSAFERGTEGAKLLQRGYAKKIICPGGNLDFNSLILHHDTVYESDIARLKLLQQGVPDSSIIVIHKGTSSKEEAEAVLKWCLKNDIHSATVVSSLFHTRRVNRIYKKLFKHVSIDVFIHGVHSNQFNEKEWWKTESGLISFNNEAMKSLLYYWKF